MQLYIKTEVPAQEEKTMHWPSSIADDAKWQMTNHKAFHWWNNNSWQNHTSSSDASIPYQHDQNLFRK